ncbi:hypothetical protein, partial [Pseudomonas syringae]|uniref:hypothetical protein n=1 Tax=Pseudomonas syringae TaxID=317 RepID=UPI001E41A3DD
CFDRREPGWGCFDVRAGKNHGNHDGGWGSVECAILVRLGVRTPVSHQASFYFVQQFYFSIFFHIISTI